MRRKTIGVISFIAVLILGAALSSMYVKPNDKDILSLFGLVFPYVYLGALLVIPLAWRHHKITFLLGVCVLIFGLKPMLSYVKPGFESKDERAQVQVLTYNAMMGVKLVDSKHQFSEKRKVLFKELMLRDPQPDVICVQEANRMVRDAYKEIIDYPYVHEIETRGAVIYSRLPMINTGDIDFGQNVNSCLWADIRSEAGDTLRIYSMHLESNRLSQESYEFLEGEEYETQQAISGIVDLVTKYPRYAGKRGNQAELVKSHMNRSPYPVIACGDLNDPPMSYTYHTIKKGLNDTFLDNGAGFGTTWIGPIPMLRIDYIFASKELENTGFYCLESDLSDHYPIKAAFNLL